MKPILNLGALNDQLLTNMATTDSSWTALPNGNYRWAVKAVYTAMLPPLLHSLIRLLKKSDG